MSVILPLYINICTSRNQKLFTYWFYLDDFSFKKEPFLPSFCAYGMSFLYLHCWTAVSLLGEILERCFHCHPPQRLHWNPVRVHCLNPHAFAWGWLGWVLLVRMQTDCGVRSCDQTSSPVMLQCPELLCLSPSDPQRRNVKPSLSLGAINMWYS